MSIKSTKTKKPVFEFTVKERKWLRGGDNGTLLSNTGQMCCLGFLCKAAGVKNYQLADGEVPSDISYYLEEDGITLPNFNEDACTNINDRTGTPLKERKALLTAEFAKTGIKINFVK